MAVDSIEAAADRRGGAETTPTRALTRFRFRPRFKGLAAGSIALGLFLFACGLVFGLSGASLYFALGTGVAGVALGGLYLMSPAWRIEVIIDDDALEVLSAGDRRFRLPWDQVVRVVASRSTCTCFVDGGSPDRSLLVPGPGATAPYDIEDKAALFDAICARVPPERIEAVALLEQARAAERNSEREPKRKSRRWFRR